jgi:hypothetical protein
LDTGALQETVAEPFPGVPVTEVGVPGTPRGVTDPDGAEAVPAPIPLLAVTVKVYAVPFVSPVTVVLVSGGVPLTILAVCGVAPM